MAAKKTPDRPGQRRTPSVIPKLKVAPGSPSTQDLYTGMSGQFAAMSEFLWRGYNVAIPAVDVGEDIFVVEAAQGVLRRVQVKTAGTGVRRGGVKTVRFGLSRGQLNLQPGGSDLFFMLLVRWDDVDPRVPWRFLLLRSEELNELRVARPAGPSRRGPPPRPDAEATDALTMTVAFSATDAAAWGHSLAKFLDRWSSDWPVGTPMTARVLNGGVNRAAPGAAPARAPSAGRETRARRTSSPDRPSRRR